MFLNFLDNSVAVLVLEWVGDDENQFPNEVSPVDQKMMTEVPPKKISDPTKSRTGFFCWGSGLWNLRNALNLYIRYKVYVCA